MQLVGHSLDEFAGTKEVNGLFSANQHPQKDVESDEMVEMRVRDENVFYAVNLARE